MLMPTALFATVQLQHSPEFDHRALADGRRSRSLDQRNDLVAVATFHPAGMLSEQTSDQSSPVVPDKTTAVQPQNTSPAPVGTAAAPYEKPEGAPASRPAGAAIAPAKQRRVKSFAIKTALVVGAGVAIGVVVAASLGSSSRPH
jgi:hypothetical protein